MKYPGVLRLSVDFLKSVNHELIGYVCTTAASQINHSNDAIKSAISLETGIFMDLNCVLMLRNIRERSIAKDKVKYLGCSCHSVPPCPR